MSRNEPQKRFQISISGCVQGVGFRPFVYRLAHQHLLVGSVANTNRGVEIDVQGAESALDRFQRDLLTLKPKPAIIVDVVNLPLPLCEATTFEIRASDSSADTTLALLPDTGLCTHCFQELFDPCNRRYLYPFLHCTSCGPRFSLFERMPFDRSTTSMADFAMCEECYAEYKNPEDRRFYSQTTCCPSCGPKLRLLNAHQESLGEALTGAVEYLHQGKIVAVKNTGGYLLLADATDEKAVCRLRLRKKRAKKPFALLMESLFQVKQVAALSCTAEQILTSPAAPIVLLEKSGKSSLAPSVACESPYYGICLPHTALQHLLLRGVGRPLVATSGNIAEMPLCINEEEAFSALGSVADAFLVHDRRIIHRLDDSLVHIIADRPMLLRRARGYIPYAVPFPSSDHTSLFGAGGQQKSSCAFYKNNRIYLSQHLGDLDSIDACQTYDNEVKSWELLLNMTPARGACDKHPAYYTSRYVQKRNLPSSYVQHHQAHAYSCMLDNQLFEKSEQLLCFSWDGTGWGEDQAIWGCEAFVIREHRLQRFASLYPFRLPGGEKAIREPRRAALGALFAMNEGIPELFTSEEYSILTRALSRRINSPLCSSMGRLFDAVSAILGCCLVSQFEGEAALALEAAALSCKEEIPDYTFDIIRESDLYLSDWRAMLRQILEDKNRVSTPAIALAFHRAIVRSMVEIAHAASMQKILLTGGVMQNKLLAECAIAHLKKEGFEPFWHNRIPPNDGGLAAGQIMGTVLCV